MSSWRALLSSVALAILIIIMLPSMEAARSPSHFRQHLRDRSKIRDVVKSSTTDLPRFHEAPAFRNGEECGSGASRRTNNSSSTYGICSMDDTNVVHVAMTLDAAYLRGSMAAIMSIVQHAGCPEDIVFHFLVSADDTSAELLRATVVQAFPYLRCHVYKFRSSLVRHRISSSVRSDLEQPLNYARNYLDSMLDACVRRVIYLDSDVVLVDDIAKLWKTRLGGGRAIGAPEYCHANFTKYFTPTFWSNATLASTFASRPRRPCYFNTGVMVIDLDTWRRRRYTRMLETWMDLQKENKIYELGSLPPFLLVFGGDVEPIEHRWNQHGLGGDYVVGSCRDLHPGPVSLLHWSGQGKPWARLDSGTPCPLDSLWAPYDLAITGRQQQHQQLLQQLQLQLS